MAVVKLIECPRDAWQGLRRVIPTEAKARYLRRLVECGFSCLDAVSFVSPAHVPQMADSEQVMKLLESDLSRRARQARTDILGIVVNRRGLERALATPGVTTLGYPHSISPTFLRKNANLSLEESRALLETMNQATRDASRGFVVYISMAFGNPYGDPWSSELIGQELTWLKSIGIKTVSLADTAGVADAQGVAHLVRTARQSAGEIEMGVHLHSRPEGAAEKVLAAFEAGCRRFDSALTGLGGCPFAGDALVGNLPTEVVVSSLAAQGVSVGVEPWALLSGVEATKDIRQRYV